MILVFTRLDIDPKNYKNWLPKRNLPEKKFNSCIGVLSKLVGFFCRIFVFR